MNNIIRRTSSNLIQKIFFSVFCIIVFINPFPLGSNRVWAWSFEALIAMSLITIMTFYSLYSNQFNFWNRFKKMKLELCLIGVWLGINFLYLIPLPISLLGVISPTVAHAYSDLNLSYGYLSLDVYASLLTLMLSLYYIMLFVLGVILINSRRRIVFILSIFLFLGVFEAIYGMYLVSVGQTGTLVQITTVATKNASGTFINKNHLVAFLSMSFILGLALRKIVNKKSENISQLGFKVRLVKYISQPLRLLDFSLFFILTGIWSTHSRAGLASFLLALTTLSLLELFSKKIKSINYKTIISTFAIGVIVLIFVADDVNLFMEMLGQNSENSMEEVIKSGQGRLLAFEQVVDNFSSYWFTGVGPGAYQSFFVNHRSIEQIFYFDHAHNDYIEFAIEYGFFGLTLLALVIAVFSYKVFKFSLRTNSSFYKTIGISVISISIYMLLHGTMDFNARIPANVVTTVIAISIIYSKIISSSENHAV